MTRAKTQSTPKSEKLIFLGALGALGRKFLEVILSNISTSDCYYKAHKLTSEFQFCLLRCLVCDALCNLGWLSSIAGIFSPWGMEEPIN